MFDALASTPLLTSLVLRYCLKPQVHIVDSLDFFDALCSFFERAPASVPVLERLVLMLEHREGQADCIIDALRNRLPGVLLDRARYPRFSHIGLNFRAQTWTNLHSGGMWFATGLVGEQRRAMLEMWRRALSGFEESSEVTVEVSDTPYAG